MNATREIANVKITVARDSMGGMDMADYLERLESAVRGMDGVTGDTDISVFAADVTSYEGLYTDSEPWQYDAMTNRLHAVAEDVFSRMCAGR